MVLLCQGIQQSSGKAPLIRAGLPPQNHNCALADGQRLVRNHQILVKLHFISQAETLRAGPEGIVKGKASGLHLIHADVAVRAGKALTEGHGFPADYIHNHQPSGKSHHRLDGIGKAVLNSFLHHQPVHHNLNIVLNILLQLNLFRQLVKIPVNPNPHIAAFSGLLQNLHMLALASPDHRRQQLDFCSLRQIHNLVYHLIHRLFADFLAALGTMGNADSGIEKSHVIVNLRYCPYGRPGVPVSGFLIDRNSRGQPLDALHIRFLHLSQKLSRIGGQGFHIPPLSLRVNGIKGQGRLARPGKAGQNHQLISGNIQRNVL